jgi:hypothetical protein
MPGTEHCSEVRRTLSPLRSPSAAFPAPGSMLPGSSLAATSPGLSPRNGLSLTCNGCAFPRFHSRVNAPALLLSTPGLRFLRPVRLSLHHHSPVCTRSWRLLRLKPVALFASADSGRFSWLRSPSGPFRPSGSKRSPRLAAVQPAFRFRPISNRSPPPFSITSVSAADHRSWSATFPRLIGLPAPSGRCFIGDCLPFPLAGRPFHRFHSSALDITNSQPDSPPS